MWAPQASSTTSGTSRRVSDLGETGDVGDGAEVGRRDDHRRDRVGLLVERLVERLCGQAVRDPELGVEL